MPVIMTPIPIPVSDYKMLVTTLIDKVLYDLAQPADITSYWSRTDVLIALDYIQREISRTTENIFATTNILEPIVNAKTIIINASGDFLRGVSAYRTYGGNTREIFFYTEEQVASTDIGWKTRTASMIRGIITDITAPGIGRLYPIPDNANNDIVVNYIKQSAHITAEYTEIGDAANQLSAWVFNGITYNNTNSGLLYWDLTNSGTTRTINIYKAAAKASGDKVATGSRTGDGTITLTATNSSGLTGTVVVVYTIDDTDAANIITMQSVEIPECDVPCLEYGMKSLIYDLETDGKDTGKQSFYKMMYGSMDANGQLTGELKAVLTRVRQRRGSTFSVLQERSDIESGLRTRPLYPWEV